MNKKIELAIQRYLAGAFNIRVLMSEASLARSVEKTALGLSGETEALTKAIEDVYFGGKPEEDLKTFLYSKTAPVPYLEILKSTLIAEEQGALTVASVREVVAFMSRYAKTAQPTLLDDLLGILSSYRAGTLSETDFLTQVKDVVYS